MKLQILALAGLATLILVPAVHANEPYFPRGERGFLRLDANKDGKLTVAEYGPLLAKRMAIMDANGDKSLSAAEIDAALAKRIEARRTRMMQLLDANHDGSITEPELSAVLEDMFDKADTDKNGGVDMAEIKTFKRGPWRKARVDGSAK